MAEDMMRLAWLSLFLLGATATAQSAPILPEHASDIGGFLPVGWTLSQKSEGDLNGDHRPDAVLTLCKTSARNDCFISVVVTLPGGGYRLVLENHTLIPHDFNGFGVFSVKRGCLTAHFSEFNPGGGLELEFAFRFQDGQFRLIGFDRVGAGHGEYLSLSVDDLTGRAMMSTGLITSSSDPGGAHNRDRTIRLARRPLLSIEQIGEFYAFDSAQLCFASSGLPQLKSFCPRRTPSIVPPARP